MQTTKVFGLLPCGMVSVRLREVGQELAMREMVADKQRVP